MKGSRYLLACFMMGYFINSEAGELRSNVSGLGWGIYNVGYQLDLSRRISFGPSVTYVDVSVGEQLGSLTSVGLKLEFDFIKRERLEAYVSSSIGTFQINGESLELDLNCESRLWGLGAASAVGTRYINDKGFIVGFGVGVGALYALLAVEECDGGLNLVSAFSPKIEAVPLVDVTLGYRF